MSGPAPFSQPRLPADFVERCRRLVRQRQMERGREFVGLVLALLVSEFGTVTVEELE
jgi:hypothetical protein